MASRYWPTRDTNLAKRFNDELVGNLKDGMDGIIGQDIILFIPIYKILMCMRINILIQIHI